MGKTIAGAFILFILLAAGAVAVKMFLPEYFDRKEKTASDAVEIQGKVRLVTDGGPGSFPLRSPALRAMMRRAGYNLVCGTETGDPARRVAMLKDQSASLAVLSLSDWLLHGSAQGWPGVILLVAAERPDGGRPGSGTDVLVAGRDFAADETLALLFLDSYFRVLDEYLENQVLLAEHLSQETGRPAGEIRTEIQDIRWPDFYANLENQFGITAQGGLAVETLVFTIEAAARRLVAERKLAANPLPDEDPYRLINSSFLKKLGARGEAAYKRHKPGAAQTAKPPAPADTVPPGVRITGLAHSYLPGEDAELGIEASDNQGLTRITFALHGTAVQAVWNLEGARNARKIRFSTKGLAPGSYSAVATAEDISGNAARDSRTLLIQAPVPVQPSPAPVPASSRRPRPGGLEKFLSDIPNR
jgi:hypothetical protein